MITQFNCQKHFHFKQFSLVWVHSLIVKTFLFQIIQFSQTVVIRLIQFSMGIDFLYTQLYIETVLYETIQFSISTQFKCKYSLIVKNISISSYSVYSNSLNSNNSV